MTLALAFLNFDKLIEKERILDEKTSKNILASAEQRADQDKEKSEIYKTLQAADLKKDELIKKMIKYIEFQVGDKYAENNIKSLLDVFSLMINESSEMREIQDVFNNNKAMEMVLFLLSKKQSPVNIFLKSLLVFCNSMLKQKNSKVQKAVFKHFKSYKQSERIFERFSAYIGTVSLYIRDEDLLKRNQAAFVESNEICIEILKFLQASCEGHYRHLQDFFRFQPNFSNQYNFLKEIINLLSILYKKIDSSNYELLILCFDSLTEMVQGPNRANQDFMLKSPILEILSNFLMFSPALGAKSRKSKTVSALELTASEVRKIKYKSIVLLEAICELPEDTKSLCSRLSKFFSVYLILVYIEELYIRYSKVFGTDLVYKSLNRVVSSEPVQPRTGVPGRLCADRGRIQVIFHHEEHHVARLLLAGDHRRCSLLSLSIRWRSMRRLWWSRR
jgi:RyR and IP3R Homology associated